MSERLKVALRVTIFVVVTLTLAFLVYFFLLRGAPQVTPPDQVITDGEETIPGGFDLSPEAGDRNFTLPLPDDGGLAPSPIAQGGPTLTAQLTTSAITSPTLTRGDSITFYDPSDGSFYTIDAQGNLVRLSNASFPEAETVTFSDDASKVALEFPDGSNVIYDLNAEQQTTLPSHWEDFGFSPDSEEVASKNISIDPNARSLVVTNTDGSQATAVAALGNNADDITINWSPNNSVVAFSETGSAQAAFGRQEIFLISPDGEAIGAIIVEGTNFSAIWSPSGETILYSVADTSRNDRPSLWTVDGAGADVGSGRAELGIETWVEKCTFRTEDTLICAIPREVPDFSGFDHRLVTSGDDVFEIDVRTGRASLLAEPVFDMQMENLSVSADGSILYFTDTFGRLNSIRLR